MSSNANQIIAEIEAYIRKYGGSLYEWYVGIAANVSDRLFSDHQVREKGDAWIYRQAPNHELARQVENHFVE